MNEIRIMLEEFFLNLRLNATVASLLTTLVVIVVWVLIGMLLSHLTKRAILRKFAKQSANRRGDTLGHLTASTVKVLIWFIVLLLIIGELGFDITPLLATAGILGLAIGFGAQNLVRDVISGFFIIMDNRYNLGETIEVSGFRGTVKAMNLRTTTVENFMGSLMVLNNGNISQVINWSRRDTVALVDFGVDYATDLNKLVQIMPEFLQSLHENNEDIIEEPSFLGVTELADSSINLRIMAKTKNGKHWATERNIRRELVPYLNRNDITIPFPQIVVHNQKDAI